MREGIHPEYFAIKASCSCGNVVLIKSTLKEDISLEVCSSCHPFYTGKQKLIDTGGRLEKFEKRFGKKTKIKEEEKVMEIEQSPAQETKVKEKVLTTSKKSTAKKEDSPSKKSKTKTSKKERLE